MDTNTCTLRLLVPELQWYWALNRVVGLPELSAAFLSILSQPAIQHHNTHNHTYTHTGSLVIMWPYQWRLCMWQLTLSWASAIIVRTPAGQAFKRTPVICTLAQLNHVRGQGTWSSYLLNEIQDQARSKHFYSGPAYVSLWRHIAQAHILKRMQHCSGVSTSNQQPIVSHESSEWRAINNRWTLILSKNARAVLWHANKVI